MAWRSYYIGLAARALCRAQFYDFMRLHNGEQKMVNIIELPWYGRWRPLSIDARANYSR
jgi:hypothetical protein